MPGPGGVLVALRPLPFAPPGLLGGELGPLVWLEVPIGVLWCGEAA